MATSGKKQQEQSTPATPESPAVPAGDSVAEASTPPPAPIRRYFAGGGHIPELGLFVGSGHVLAEQQPDGSWRLVREDVAGAALVDMPADAAPAPAPETDVPAE